MRRHVPCSGSAHRLPGHVDPPLVDGKLAPQRIDDLQSESRSVTEAGSRPRDAVTGGGISVADPATVGLWCHDIAGKCPLILRQQPHSSAEDVAEAQLLLVVGP